MNQSVVCTASCVPGAGGPGCCTRSWGAQSAVCQGLETLVAICRGLGVPGAVCWELGALGVACRELGALGAACSGRWRTWVLHVGAAPSVLYKVLGAVQGPECHVLGAGGPGCCHIPWRDCGSHLLIHLAVFSCLPQTCCAPASTWKETALSTPTVKARKSQVRKQGQPPACPAVLFAGCEPSLTQGWPR